jgi:hypothetical protein
VLADIRNVLASAGEGTSTTTGQQQQQQLDRLIWSAGSELVSTLAHFLITDVLLNIHDYCGRARMDELVDAWFSTILFATRLSTSSSSLVEEVHREMVQLVQLADDPRFLDSFLRTVIQV